MTMIHLSAGAQHPTTYEGPRSENRITYELDAVLDADLRAVRGQAQISWRNPDSVPVDTLQFHLYLNAFRSSRSTFMREGGGRHRGFVAGGTAGGLDIEGLSVLTPDGERDLTNRLVYIRPDDGNAYDSTVAFVRLPTPVMPGKEITVSARFLARLPEIVARTGYAERPDGTLFFMVAQWFPKLGVYEVPGQRYVPDDAPRGRWNTHQFHANSEFYADFGTYTVTIDVPLAYVVGATGVRTVSEEQGARKRLRYFAQDVHDFAWTASPAFIAHEDQWEHVTLRLLLQPEHRGQAPRHFRAAKVALAAFDEILGPYPYTELTLVDGLGGANGMEYPMLITCGTTYGLPGRLRLPEVVTVHEFGHQYFYGLLASNEFEEAWLDEGMTSYFEAKIMDEAYGPGSLVNVPGLRLDDAIMHRLNYAKPEPSRAVLQTRAWQYASGADYGMASYSKAATVLRTLEGFLGWPTTREVFRTYFERWRYRHPTARDFQAVAEEVSGEDLEWFFSQYVYGSSVVDYAVGAIEPAGEGKSTVRLLRLADGVFPQRVRIRFADGSAEDLHWDGSAAEHRLEFARSVTEVYLDPDNEVWLDANRLNNRLRTEGGDAFALKAWTTLAVWIQRLLAIAAL